MPKEYPNAGMRKREKEGNKDWKSRKGYNIVLFLHIGGIDAVIIWAMRKPETPASILLGLLHAWM